MFVGSGASMTDTWFPAEPACSGVRTDSGTKETSGCSGSASWSSSQRRMTVVHSAITTSFTVTPKAFLIRLTSSNGNDPYANRRCGLIGPLNGVSGATSLGRATSWRPRPCRVSRFSTLPALASNPTPG